jgi:pyruvate kinase
VDVDTRAQSTSFRRTKIVATLGPASSSADLIEALVARGVGVFRLNMSHGTYDDHRALSQRVRAAAEKLGTEVAVFADLCGPKIRVGRFAGGHIELETGGSVVVTTRHVEGGPGLVPSQYEDLGQDVVAGDRILLDDGNLELRVGKVEDTEITCSVVAGGILKDHKGMNLPGVRVSAPALTEKDKRDAAFALDLGVDFLALSFVRQPRDVEDLRSLLAETGRDVPIIAKIEKPEALEHIEAVLGVSDAIMIARGDLGVELPPEEVPNIQEQLVDLARAATRPVIVATQMLESMMTNPRPTRAEVTDVANAVRSGADAVMLSGETAAGRHPLEAVRMMDLIVRETEFYLQAHGAFGSFDAYTPTPVDRHRPLVVDDAVAKAAAGLSRDLGVRALVVWTRSGRSMAVTSSARPAAPVVGVSAELAVLRFGCLLWGVLLGQCVERDVEDFPSLAGSLVKARGLAKGGDQILLLQGFSSDPAYNMPSVTVATVT